MPENSPPSVMMGRGEDDEGLGEVADHRVLQSIETDGGARCVDLFVRPDGSFGFETYRRDGEDPRGWYPTGHHGARAFACEADARAAAGRVAPWVEVA